MKTYPGLVDRNGVRQTITHGWNAKEVQMGQYYVDGYAVVDNRRIILEFNGCAYHSCYKCKQVRIHKNDEEKRKEYFRSLDNVTLIEISSCEWHAQKLELKNFKPEISPLLWRSTVETSEMLRLIMKGKVYGFVLADLTKTPEAEKWMELNWPPLLQKDNILYEDLPSWMQNLYNPSDFPKVSIVQKMHAKNILLHTELLNFYLENGFAVVKIHKVFEYQAAHCFKKVFDTVYTARVSATQEGKRSGASAEEKKGAEMKATAVKLVANSMYGITLTVCLI